MSGGHFNYEQSRILEISDLLLELIETNGENEWRNYSAETIAEFKRGFDALNTAYTYAQRIDWLVSGDDGEETFHKRLAEEITPSRDQVAVGRLKKKIAKLLQQRETLTTQLAHYRHVLDVSPFIENRYDRYEDRKREQERVKALEARVQEQAALIKLLQEK